MIIHSVTPQEYILPPKSKKRILFTSSKQKQTNQTEFMKIKNGVPCVYRRRDEEEDDILFSTDPTEYL